MFFLNGDIPYGLEYLKPLKEVYEINMSKLPNNRTLKLRVDSIQENIINTINERDPNFFETFKKNIESGNPMEVRNVLILGAEYLKIVLNNDRFLTPYIKNENNNKLIKAIDTTKILKSNGTLSPQLLINEINQTFENSKRTMSNLGMLGSESQVTLCAAATVVAVAAAAITVAVAQTYAAVLNAAGAVNVYLAVNVYTYINITGNNGGGTTTCATCHSGATGLRLENSLRIDGQPMKVSNKINCGRYQFKSNISSELFAMQICEMFKRK